MQELITILYSIQHHLQEFFIILKIRKIEVWEIRHMSSYSSIQQERKMLKIGRTTGYYELKLAWNDSEYEGTFL